MATLVSKAPSERKDLCLRLEDRAYLQEARGAAFEEKAQAVFDVSSFAAALSKLRIGA